MDIIDYSNVDLGLGLQIALALRKGNSKDR